MSSNIHRSTRTSTAEDQTVHRIRLLSRAHATSRAFTQEPHASLNAELVNNKSYISNRDSRHTNKGVATE